MDELLDYISDLIYANRHVEAGEKLQSIDVMSLTPEQEEKYLDLHDRIATWYCERLGDIKQEDGNEN